jgi:hypothetical protein
LPAGQHGKTCRPTNNICPNINTELLLVSRLKYTVRTVLWPLAVAVKIYDAISTKTDTKSVVLETWQAWDPGLAVNGTCTAIAHAVVTSTKCRTHSSMSSVWVDLSLPCLTAKDLNVPFPLS